MVGENMQRYLLLPLPPHRIDRDKVLWGLEWMGTVYF